jgi:6-phosphogluconolactonase
LAISPAGTFLYVNDINSNTVSGFSIDPNTGGLVAVPGVASPTGQTPIGILADPNGKFLYVGDHMQDTISGYRIDPQSGVLTRISVLPLLPLAAPGAT